MYSIDYKFGGFVNVVIGDVFGGVDSLEGEGGLLLCRPCVFVSYLVKINEGFRDGED